MIEFETLTPARIEEACADAIAPLRRRRSPQSSRTDAAARTFENTFLALEAAADIIGQASGAYAFMAYVSADDGVRETAREWDEKLSKYAVELGFRDDLYGAVKQYAATTEAAALEGEELRLLERTLRDYRRNGFDLPPEQARAGAGADEPPRRAGHGVPQGDRHLGRRHRRAPRGPRRHARPLDRRSEGGRRRR